MSLLKLPNEILSEIAKFVGCEDILHFVLTNKLIFKLSGDALNAHRLRSQYGQICLHIHFEDLDDHDYVEEDECDAPPICHPFQFLQKLFDDVDGKSVAAYVSRLHISANCLPEDDVGMDNDSGYYIEDGDSEHMNGQSAIKAEIVPYYDRMKAVLDTLNVCPNASSTDHWLSLAMDGHQGVMLGIIIAILPRLKSLRFSRYPPGNTALVEMLYADQSAETSKLMGLQNLKSKKLVQNENTSSGPLPLLKAFARSRSARTIRLTSIKVVEQYHHDLDINLPDEWISPLVHLHLHDCLPSVGSTAGFSTSLKNLQTFCLKYSADWDFRLILMIDWLQSHSCKTLLSLDMGWYSSSGFDGFVGSLRSFEAMTYLKLPYAAFVNRDETRYHTGDIYLERLITLLPPRLESLVLIEPGRLEHVDYLFQELCELHSILTPKLREIRFESFGEDLDPMTIRYRKVPRHSILVKLKETGIRVFLNDVEL